MRNRRPIRDWPNKWHVPVGVWEEDWYPPFASGSGYIMSSDVVNCATKKFENDIKFNPMEDVFAGSLAYYCDAEAVEIPYIYCCDESGNKEYYMHPDDKQNKIPYEAGIKITTLYIIHT